MHQDISGLFFLTCLYNNKCCLIHTMSLRVGHNTALGVIMPLLKFWGYTIFSFKEIMFSVDLILRNSEMGVVRFMGVSPLVCKESVSAFQNRNFKEHWIWYIDYKTCTISIFCNKVTKIFWLVSMKKRMFFLDRKFQ